MPQAGEQITVEEERPCSIELVEKVRIPPNHELRLSDIPKCTEEHHYNVQPWPGLEYYF
jgi:hypothetical protein